MDKDTHAREAQLRAISIFTRRPEQAKDVNTGMAEVRDGLTCTYEQGGHSVTIDMPAAIGGSDAGPTPGFFGRAAICGCLAVGIKMTATRENIRVDAVRAGIEQDWDNRGVLGMDGAEAGPLATRIAIEIESPAPRDTIDALIEKALKADPWFIAYRDAQAVTMTVRLTAPAP